MQFTPERPPRQRLAEIDLTTNGQPMRAGIVGENARFYAQLWAALGRAVVAGRVESAQRFAANLAKLTGAGALKAE